MELILKAVKSLVSGINAKLAEIKKTADNAAETANNANLMANKAYRKTAVFPILINEDENGNYTMENPEDFDKIYEATTSGFMVVAKVVHRALSEGMIKETYLPLCNYNETKLGNTKSNIIIFGGFTLGAFVGVIVQKIGKELTVSYDMVSIDQGGSQ